MFKGKGNSGGGAGGEGNASRNMMLDTSFRFQPGKDDVEGIIGSVRSSSSASPLTPLSPLSPLGGSDSGVEPITSLINKSNTTFPAAINQSDDEDSRVGSHEDAPPALSGLPQSPVTESSASSSTSSGHKNTSGSTGHQDKDSPTPPPLPSTPQHSAVKDLVSRFRKGPKDQKSKEIQLSVEKDKRESPHSQSTEGVKENHGRTKEAKDKEALLALREPGKDGGRERESRSPSPGGEPRSDIAKGSNKEAKDKDGHPSQESRDASWFGGIKGKIVKRFEEKRARSQSVPVVAKVIHSQGEGTTSADIDAVMLGSQGEALDYDDVERAEEADPERMALEQGFGDCELGSDSPQETNEDDSWEKVELPSDEVSDSQQRAFYRDFAAVKERWASLDTAYIAARFPDIIDEFRTMSTRTIGVIIPLLLAIIVLPLPAFVKGFIVASLAWLVIWRLSAILCPPVCATPSYFPPLSQSVPLPTPPPLLMPRAQELNGGREGWLNALPAGETYHVKTHQSNQCHSVHVRLDGTMLRIRTLKDKLPRRAMWDERRKDTSSVVWSGKQWFIELDGATVRLLPEGLSGSKLWNKRYPIIVSTPARTGEDAKEVLLFSRTCRDKEYWFRLFKKASEQSGANATVVQTVSEKDKLVASDDDGIEKSLEEECAFTRRPLVDFSVYMNNLGLSQSSGAGSGGTPSGSSTTSGSVEERKQQQSNQSSCPSLSLAFRDADTQWLNVLAGRLLFDFFTQPRFAEAVRSKFQKKLSKIIMPFFMEKLTITDIDLGARTPLIRRTSAAVHCPDTGVWLDLEVAYNGCFQVTVHTKLNLMKLKKQGGSLLITENREQEMQELAPGETRPIDEDIPSEDDDDDISEGTNQSGETELEEAQGATSQKILQMVDRISQWSLFQQATDYTFVRKKMEELSNTDLKLTIQLSSLAGRLAVNIPPPPTDRLWYGFRSVPRLEFKAIPQMGEREVAFRVKLAAVIEKALFQEFQRVLVMPNMDDLQIDIMEAQRL